MNRREFLAALGASAALAPFLPLWEGRPSGRAFAQTQPSAAPRRLILWWTPHGTVREKWLPTGNENSFQLHDILAPLAPFQQKLTVLDGLSLDPGKATGHETFPAVWTASPAPRVNDQVDCTEFGWGISVDQTIAAELGKHTPYKSLELGWQAMSNINCPGSRMIFSGPNQPIAPSEDPWDVLNRLFGKQLSMSELDRMRAERKSSIDLVLAELDDLRKLAPAEDKKKIDAHIAHLRSIEDRLSLAAQACKAPTLPNRPGDLYAMEQMTTMVDLHSDLMTAALACDQTRVVSMEVTKGDNDGSVYKFLDSAMVDGHHDISHKGDSDQTARNQLETIYTYYAKRFAYLLGKLDSVLEDNGKTLLDNSLVVWGTEVSKGNDHSTANMPFVLAGSAGGVLKTGRFVTVPSNTWHNRLLVSLCHAMGLTNVQTFGTSDSGKGSGPLSTLFV
jgi:hypothetical protein